MPYGTVNADVIQTSTSGGILGAGNASIMKNRIINGAMVINQRGFSGTITSDSTYTLDRWTARNDLTSKMSISQSSDAPAGFNNSLLVTSLSAYTMSAGGYYFVSQYIEGYNIADLGWGTANAKTVTLSFWVKSSLTGTFGGSLVNDGQTRSYPFTYTISAANTWEQKSVTIAGETSGTWLTTNGLGIRVSLEVGIGTTYSGTAGSWASTLYYGATGATSILATNGATLQWTGVQLEVGSSATGFEYVNYQTSLANCQRYYYKIINGSGNSRVLSGYITTTTQALHVLNMPVSMRTSPSALETNGTAAHYAIANLNTDTTCSAVPSFNDATINTVSVVGSVTAGLVAGGGCQLRYLNATAYLAVSAEL
jgi:hypothetical protein